MRWRLRRPAGIALALTVTLAAGAAAGSGTGGAPATAITLAAHGRPAKAALCSSARHPRMAAEIARGITRALAATSSVVGITAYDPAKRIRCEYHQWWDFPSASVVKVIILGTLLHELQARHEYLSTRQVSLTTAMITQSDNDAATALWNEVGMARLRYFLAVAKMKHTILGRDGYWGLTSVNAHDEMLLLRLLVTKNRLLDGASRAYALNLMARVIRWQRWGVTAGARTTVRAHVKNGWLPVPTLWVVNSIGDFTRRSSAYSIAILTAHNPDMNYGVGTIESIARAINRVMGGR
jgi:beta-lactamase class A